MGKPGEKTEAQGNLLLRRMPAAEGSHCVAADEQGHVVVCNPRGGRLLFYEDEAPGPAR